MKSWKSLVVFVVLASTQLACSNGNSFLKAMDVNVTQQNNQSFINLSAEVSLGNSTLASLTIPVRDPNSGLEIGQVSFGQAANGNQQITISLDATTVLKADPTLGSTLPNGLPLPASVSINGQQMLAFPILNNSRVYVGGDLKSNIVIGVALGIPGLDGVMGGIGFPGNIFFSQVFNPNLSGLAGIYASPTANQNGIAVFGKVHLTAPVGVPTNNIVAGKVAPAAMMSSGVIDANGNAVVENGLDQDSQKGLVKFFYGKKRTLRPH